MPPGPPVTVTRPPKGWRISTFLPFPIVRALSGIPPRRSSAGDQIGVVPVARRTSEGDLDIGPDPVQQHQGLGPVGRLAGGVVGADGTDDDHRREAEPEQNPEQAETSPGSGAPGSVLTAAAIPAIPVFICCRHLSSFHCCLFHPLAVPMAVPMAAPRSRRVRRAGGERHAFPPRFVFPWSSLMTVRPAAAPKTSRRCRPPSPASRRSGGRRSAPRRGT